LSAGLSQFYLVIEHIADSLTGNVFRQGAQMIPSKLKILSAAVTAVALVASLAFGLTVRNGTSAHPDYGASNVVSPDGKLIGVAPNPSTRSHLDGLLDVQ
jgi:hypothetical protein